MEKRSYRRPEKFYITSDMEAAYASVIIPIGDVQLYIIKNHIEIKGDVSDIRHNGKVPECEFDVEYGDTVEIKEYSMTLYRDYIEIYGDLNDVDNSKIQLERIKNVALPFNGFPYFKRSPRIIYRVEPETIELQHPEEKMTIGKDSLGEILAPGIATVALSIAMAFLLKRGAFVLMSVGMALIGIIFSIKNFFKKKKEVKEQNIKREELYDKYILKVRKKIVSKRKYEEESIDYSYPDVHKIERMVEGYSSRLYEKTITDEDFMEVCLGSCKGDSLIDVKFSTDELSTKKDELADRAKSIVTEFKHINNKPVTVDLKKSHLGLVGSKDNIHEQLKIIISQLCFFHSYHDLEIIFVHSSEYKNEFKYLDWYPHFTIHSINAFGRICSEQAKEQVLGSIQQILKDRKQRCVDRTQDTVFKPHFLFIIDEPKLVINHAFTEYLQGEAMGFSIIYTTDQVTSLPEYIKSVCIINNKTDGVLLLKDGSRINQKFTFDCADNIDFENMSRTLCRIIHEQGISSRIPEKVTFLEMYGADKPEDLDCEDRWQKNESRKSLAVPIGLRAKDDLIMLDLHEQAHGPHGLIAGTTGSGKSELVQAYILSLAVNFHPYEVGFLLIDYKGGGMANQFEDLPHLLGTMTNLDKSESMRAMAGINSELARRQKIFGECGVANINGYNKLFKLGKVKEPIPHLFIISDEFAELKKEQPEFMQQLISAARIGRSLGVHLILATQKPSGIVDDQIWSNTRFRICLKVADTGDSQEMIKTPDAANIVHSGRAYLQVGNNEIYELFQSAYSGATFRTGETKEDKEDNRVYLVNELGQGELLNKDLSSLNDEIRVDTSELKVTVEYLKRVYDLERKQSIEKYGNHLEVNKPWLPSLKHPLVSPYTRDVRDSSEFEMIDTTLPIGMVDIPEEQRQDEYVLDLLKNGHFVYMASSGYGKTTLLTQIVLGLSMKNSVRNMYFYLIDLGNSGLIPLKDLPHVADYMNLDSFEKIRKLEGIILEEMSKRKQIFARDKVQNISVYNEQEGSQKLPIIVLAIDNFDAVSELSDSFNDFLIKLLRDGAGLGIYLLVTMNRENSMRYALLNNFKEKIAGFNFEPSEVTGFIGRSKIELSDDKPGRAVVKLDNINLMQLYTPVESDDPFSYNTALCKLVDEVKNKSTEKRAKAIPVIPEELSYEKLVEISDEAYSDDMIPVGIETEKLELRGIDLSQGKAIMVGAQGTGKTNVLKTVINQIIAKDRYECLAIIDTQSMLFYEGDDRIIHASTTSEIKDVLDNIRNAVAARQELLAEKRIDDPTIKPYDFYKALPPVYVVIDSIQNAEREMDDADELDMLTEALNCGIYVIITSDPKISYGCGSFAKKFKDSTSGICLGDITNQDVISFSNIREHNKDIRFGYLVKQEDAEKIMLAVN